MADPNTNPNPPVALPDGVIKIWPFKQNADGTLSPDTSGGGGGGDVNLTGINGTPPALTNPLPVELSDGTQSVGTPGNPLSVNVITGGGSNASVGLTGTTAPTSATEIGGVDPDTGNLNSPAVKPASTPAAATDPSLVVQVSPNQPTSNMSGTAPGTAPANTSIVGGKYNATPPAPTDGQTLPLQLDAVGALKVDIVAGGSSNPTIGLVGQVAPTSATEIGAVNSLGQLTPVRTDGLGNLAVAFTGTQLTVLQEMLTEMRAIRRLLMVVYEESGEGNPAVLLDDSNDPLQADYN